MYRYSCASCAQPISYDEFILEIADCCFQTINNSTANSTCIKYALYRNCHNRKACFNRYLYLKDVRPFDNNNNNQSKQTNKQKQKKKLVNLHPTTSWCFWSWPTIDLFFLKLRINLRLLSAERCMWIARAQWWAHRSTDTLQHWQTWMIYSATVAQAHRQSWKEKILFWRHSVRMQCIRAGCSDINTTYASKCSFSMFARIW